MANLINRVMNGGIYKVTTRSKRNPELSPSEIPTLKDYTSRLVDQKWLRLAARRKHG
nr:NinE family protein [Citrobacter amalonaticus]